MSSICKFKNDETGYVVWRSQHETGFVLNHFDAASPQFNVLHKVTCPFLWREKDEGARTVIEKWCNDDETVLASKADNDLGVGKWKRCGFCFRNRSEETLGAATPTTSLPLVDNLTVRHYTPILSHSQLDSKPFNDLQSLWIDGEPATWLGSGEKEWKTKLCEHLTSAKVDTNPACLDIEFRFVEERIYKKDIDNLLTPVLEAARDSGWLGRGFLNLGSIFARKVVVEEKSQIGVQIRSFQEAPAKIMARCGILVEANIDSFEADAVKWAMYDQAFRLYHCRPELRFAPQTPLRVDFRVTVETTARRRSIAALLKPSIDGLEPILGHPTNLLPVARADLNRRLAPQDEMILELDYHIRGGTSNFISAAISPLNLCDLIK